MTSKPLFVINFKAYENSCGAAASQLAKQIEEVAKIKGVSVIICVPATEISRISGTVKIPVYAQHVDAMDYGKYTGWLPAKLAKAAGAKGTLVNHSEHRVGDDVEKIVSSAKEAGLDVIVCARDATEVKILRNLPADFIAVEPPELIASDISIATGEPELITHSVKHCPDRLLAGAGVRTHADVLKSKELGAKGVILSSEVMKSKNVKETLLQLFGGW